MKVALVYNLVEKQSSKVILPPDWADILERFVDSYKKHNSGYPHDFYICVTGGKLSNNSKNIFKGIEYSELNYYGGGWDIGAYQFSSQFLMEYEYIVCMNTQVHFLHNEWLSRLMQVIKQYGVGVYASSGSLEISPHLRTSFIVVPPGLLLKYPIKVVSRYDACLFEHSPKNFTQWAKITGYATYVVETKKVYDINNLSISDSGFRKGNQEELLVGDRHSELYIKANEFLKKELTDRMNGLGCNNFQYAGRLKYRVIRIKAAFNLWFNRIKSLC